MAKSWEKPDDLRKRLLPNHFPKTLNLFSLSVKGDLNEMV